MMQLSKIKRNVAKGFYQTKGVIFLLRHTKNNISPESEYARQTIDKIIERMRSQRQSNLETKQSKTTMFKDQDDTLDPAIQKEYDDLQQCIFEIKPDNDDFKKIQNWTSIDDLDIGMR